MLALLIDENYSPEIARQVVEIRPDIRIESVYRWRNGLLEHTIDREILITAVEHGWTLVTRDVHTIPKLIRHLYEEGISHGGIILVSDRTFRPDDYGAILKAIIRLWDECKDWTWIDRVVYLSRTSDE